MNRDYFETEIKSLTSRLGPNPVVEVTTVHGKTYHIRNVVKAEQGYVTLEVRPLTGDAKTPAQELLTVPYPAISSVVLSSTSAQQYKRIGFTQGQT